MMPTTLCRLCPPEFGHFDQPRRVRRFDNAHFAGVTIHAPGCGCRDDGRDWRCCDATDDHEARWRKAHKVLARRQRRAKSGNLRSVPHAMRAEAP